MKKHIYLLLLALYYLSTCYACNKGSIDDTPPPNPIDTTNMTTDTTASDTIVYEDAPIWFPGSQKYGFAQGLKNGKAFEATAVAIYSKDSACVRFLIGTYSQEDYLRDYVSIGNILTGELREYRLVPYKNVDTVRFINYSTRVDGGDVIGDLYNLDTLYENKLIMTEIDLEQEIARGEFSAAFHIDSNRAQQDPLNPKYCVFEEVYFECKIID